LYANRLNIIYNYNNWRINETIWRRIWKNQMN
jgi:hypothetical protein